MPKRTAVVSVFDPFLYGDGVYRNASLLALAFHAGPTPGPASALGRGHRADDSIPDAQWRTCSMRPCAAMGWAMIGSMPYLRITISRGEGEVGLDPHSVPVQQLSF